MAFQEKNSKTKMIKCHQFAYSLDWLKDNIENSQILLVRRGNKECFDWWKEAGGWDISYPNYQWYVDDHHMYHYIEAENKLADDFVKRTGNTWSMFDSEDAKFSDVKICLIKT
jgi:hypothetical protein